MASNGGHNSFQTINVVAFPPSSVDDFLWAKSSQSLMAMYAWFMSVVADSDGLMADCVYALSTA